MNLVISRAVCSRCTMRIVGRRMALWKRGITTGGGEDPKSNQLNNPINQVYKPDDSSLTGKVDSEGKWADPYQEALPRDIRYTVPFGANVYNREQDEEFRVLMYLFWAFGLVFTGFLTSYLPDWKTEWALREAYIELHRREAAGLPHVDPNLVPIEKLRETLPTKEELHGFPLIV